MTTWIIKLVIAFVIIINIKSIFLWKPWYTFFSGYFDEENVQRNSIYFILFTFNNMSLLLLLKK